MSAQRNETFIKRVLPHTLLGRALLIILSPLVLLQIVSTWVFYDRHYDTITKRLTQGLAGDLHHGPQSKPPGASSGLSHG